MSALIPLHLIQQGSTPEIIQSTCAYCGVGCGVDVSLKWDKSKNGQPTATLDGISGTKEHPANHGRLCVKGNNLLATNSLKDRLLNPIIGNEKVSWDTALDKISQTFQRIIEQHGPEAIAFYGSGQLLTEDYYVLNKLMKGYIGVANIDTNSRLCMSSAVSGYKRAFGADAVPNNYEDLEQTDCLVIVGSNPAWAHPVLYQRIEQAKKINPAMRIIVIDPRRTMSCEIADLHLKIKSGSDGAIFNGLLYFLIKNNKLDHEFIANHTEGMESCFAACEDWPIDKVAQFCDIAEADLHQFYQSFSSAESAITFYSMGINQSSSGVDKANAIINCHLATGKIGIPGSGPFSITGQPNAMGGREVGGLANLLAAHMDIDNAEHRQLLQEFWQSPNMAQKAGPKAMDMFQQAADGKIKAIWIMATNPLVSMPNRKVIEKALQRCELVVVSDCVASNDTLEFAHVKLPATGWSEKNGMVTNSERRISRQRGLMPPSGEAKHDWQIISAVARRMGFSGFDFEHPADVFNEHIALSAYKNEGSRCFDISGLGKLTYEQYDSFKPIQWPVNAKNPTGTKRLFTDKHFFTPSGKAQFITIEPRLPVSQRNDEFPWSVNTGRIRDQWHTMTRTSKAPGLMQHTATPYIQIHPDDARELDVADNQLLQLESRVSGDGKVILPVKLDSSMRHGEFFIPMHWNRQFSGHANVSLLFDSIGDPISGQPESKFTAVKAEKLQFDQYITLWSRHSVPRSWLDEISGYWVKTPLEEGVLFQLATQKSDTNWVEEINQLMRQNQSGINSEKLDRDQAIDLQSHYVSKKLTGFEIFIFGNDLQTDYVLLHSGVKGSSAAESEMSAWLEHELKEPAKDESAYWKHVSVLLKGEPDETFRQGKIVCSCYQVREKPIIAAIKNGCDSVEALGKELQCGTKCGSCKSELSNLLLQYANAETTA